MPEGNENPILLPSTKNGTQWDNCFCGVNNNC